MKSLKNILILIGLSLLAMPLNVFAKDKNYRNYNISYDFYNKKNKKNITFKNKSFYENIANLAVYYIFKNTPKISEEAKKNIIFSRNNLDSNGILILKNFLISDEDEKKIKEHLKKIKEKIKEKIDKNDDEDIIKYFEKLIKDKNINIEEIKNSYIKLIKDKIEEIEKNINNLEQQKENKFFIEFENKKIKEEIENSSETNILKKIESKNDEKLLKEGKESVKKDIKYKKFFIEKLRNDVKEIKKVEKKHLEDFLVNLLTAYIKNNKFLRNSLMPGMRHSLRFNFKNTHKVSKHIRYIALKFFDEILYEEMMNLKNNEHIKNYFKEKEKDIKNTVKDYKKNHNLSEFEAKSFFKHLKFLNRSGFDRLSPNNIFDCPIIFGYLNIMYFYSENDKKLLDIVISIIKSDRFKQKLKKDLNKENIEKIKQNYLNYLNFIYKYLKKEYEKTKKEDLVEVGKKDLEQTIENQKQWLNDSKKEKNKNQIKECEEKLNESKETLKNNELLKEKGIVTNQNSINAYKNSMARIKNTIKKINNIKLKDIKKAFNIIELDGLFKLVDNTKNPF